MSAATMVCALCDGVRGPANECPACDGAGTMRAQIAAGEACTYSIGSDRYAGVVSEVFRKGREVWVTLEGRGDAAMRFFTRRADGSYRLKGERYGFLTFGVAERYRAPEF